ncbi:MAG: NTP transferase domain-containing protein [Candidatus Marinimicrobia bacterium]|nr:NTP transferase domain-containing protein [Candidatus Neomarinimicrobiota bacterium]
MDSDLPKVLHPIGKLPMISRVVQTAQELGASRIIPVLGYKNELVQSALKDEPVECVLQLQQLGTAHAVLQCHDTLKKFNGNVLILYGDVPLITVETLAGLLSVHDNQNALGTILTADLLDPTGYGRVIRDENGDLSKIVEEKDATEEERAVNEINSGIYVFKSWTLFNLLPMVGNNNSQKEYYLPDVLNLLLEKNEKVAIEKINNFFEIQGVNNPEQLSEMNDYYEKNAIHI